jgi:tRNA threonylcarbamoyladenosine biosynthesis protein TsaB
VSILGIDTSTAFCGAALVEDGKPVSSAAAGVPHAHAERLLPLVDECLRAAAPGVPPPAAVAVASGPGSFTGLRVGFSVAKGICFARGCALVAVPTFTAWARAAAALGLADDGGLMLAVMAAGRDDAYAAIYRREGRAAREVRAPFLAPKSGLPGIAAGLRDAVVMTDDVARAGASLGSFPGERIIGAAGGGRNPAVFVAIVGEEMARAGMTADLRSAEPAYLKDFSFTVKGA